MSRRRPPVEDDALDLFLDAISNVFGGILFIALAVVVLLQFTVPAPESPAGTAAPVTSADTAELPEALLAILHAEAVPRDAQRVEARERLRDAMARLEAELDAIDQAGAAQRDRAAATLALSEQVQSQLGERERELLDAQRTLEALTNRPTQRVRAAKFRPTAKQEVPLMIAAGRVLRVADDRGRVDRVSLEVDAGGSSARPAAGAGKALPAGPDGDAALTRLLADLDPQRHYLNAAVWPDGFAAARRLRDAAIDLGFEFTLTPIAEGAGVPFNAASGVQ